MVTWVVVFPPMLPWFPWLLPPIGGPLIPELAPPPKPFGAPPCIPHPSPARNTTIGTMINILRATCEEGRSTHRYSFSNLREEDSRECHIKINHQFELFIVIHYNDHSIKDSNNSQLLRYFNHTINSPPSHFAIWIFNIHFSFSLSLFFFIT